MAVVGYATIQLIPSLKGFSSSASGQMGPVVRSVGSDAGKQAGGLFGSGFVGTVGKIMAAAGIYEIGSRVAGGISDAITTGIKGFADLQTYTISFKTLLGSASKANDMIRDLYAFAAKTPFDVEGSVVGAQKLLGVGVAAKDVVPTLTTLGDATAALGGSTADFNSVLLAYSQIMARGKVSTQDLYQISNTGIPIFQLMSKALGKPVGEIQKLIETGKLASDDVLPKLLKQMNKDYGGAMAGQAQTLSGLWSTFKDTMGQVLTKALTPVGEWLVKILPGATTAATQAIEWLQGKFGDLVAYFKDPSNKFAETFQPLIDGLKNTDWEGLLTSVGDAFSAMWTIVQPIIESVDSLIGDNLPQAAATLSSILDGVFTPVKDSANAAADGTDRFSQGMNKTADQIAADAPTWYDGAKALGLVGSQSVNTVLGLGQMAGALLQGKDATTVATNALNGEYGPGLAQAYRNGLIFYDGARAAFTGANQVIGNFVTTSLTRIVFWGTTLVANMTRTVANVAAAIVSGVARWVQGFVTGMAQLAFSIISGGARAVANMRSVVQQIIAAVTGIDLSGSGRSLIQGFINGITSMIDQARRAASNVVSAVANFFPHSPAPEGPFSGRGWTLYSGRSLIDGFAQGVKQRQGGLRSLLNNALAAPNLAGPSVSLAGSVNSASQARAGNYIGSATINTTNGNAGVIDSLNFYLRNLDRGGR